MNSAINLLATLKHQRFMNEFADNQISRIVSSMLRPVDHEELSAGGSDSSGSDENETVYS